MTSPKVLLLCAAVAFPRLALAEGAATTGPAEHEQAMGPTQLVEPGTGVVVLELPSGTKGVTIAVPPGHYLLQRHLGDKTFARELTVESDEPKLIEEDGLTLVGRRELVREGLSADERHHRFTSLVPACAIAGGALALAGGGAAFSIWSTRSSDHSTQYLTTAGFFFGAAGVAAIVASVFVAVPLINRWEIAASAAPAKDGATVAIGGVW